MTHEEKFYGLIEELKKKMITEDEFIETYRYFFDNLGEDRDFVQLGKRENDPELKKLLSRVGKSFLDDAAIMTNFLLIAIPRCRFVHGAFHMGGRLIVFFFFKEIGMGMAAMSHPGPEIRTLLARFSAIKSPSNRLSLHGLSKPVLH